jgi:hypothetical protein
MRRPNSCTVALFGLTSPRMVFMVVDLPQALPPSRETISPSPTVRETFLRAWMGP